MAALINGANVVLTRGDSVLMQLRDDIPSISFPNHWSLIGGRADGQETPEQNAARELLEETGYQMKSPRFVMRSIVTGKSDERVKVFVYTEEYDGVQPILCLEGQEMKFIPVTELENLTVVPWQREFIAEVFKQR